MAVTIKDAVCLYGGCINVACPDRFYACKEHGEIIYRAIQRQRQELRD